MANTIIKGQQIADAAILLLHREIVLPRLVWRQPDDGFMRQLNDTLTLRVPAILDPQTRTMRANTALTFGDFTETSVAVALNTHVYSGIKIRDEELTLDIVNFATQVLNPQIRAVAEGLEEVIAAAIVAADPDPADIDFVEGTDEPFDVLVDARKVLNILNVPMSNRVFLAGANVEAALLKSEKFNRVDQSGTSDALHEATLSRIAGFTVVTSNAIDPDEAWAFHQTAIAFGAVAPALPDGASMKGRTSFDGIGMRFLKDYAPENSTGPVDRSLVDLFAGAASVEEAGTNKRIVHINFTGAAS